MSTSDPNDITSELQSVMTEAMLKMQALCDAGDSGKSSFLSIVKLFVMGVISTAADLAEVSTPGSAPFLYADIEAVAKNGGMRAIQERQLKSDAPGYSVSQIKPGDDTMAMNYLGHHLSADLFKRLHELPEQMRSQEMLLRAVEALLTNLLNQKFDSSHAILDSFCEHVHMALSDLTQRQQGSH